MGELDRIRQFLADEDILMCFNGPFRHSILEELGQAVRSHLEAEDVRPSAMTDVFSVFIEATQNASNYARSEAWTQAEKARAQGGVLVIGREADRYRIRCGNFIRPAAGPPLLARLDALAALDPVGLKALYKTQLRGTRPSGPGAGLGLIRMARTASRPLSYEVAPGEVGLDFFSLTVHV